MLNTVLAALVVMWVLGMLTGYAMGGLIHLLLVFAIALVMFRIIRGSGSGHGHSQGHGH